MTETIGARPAVPRIEELSVKNYRALRDLQLRPLTPLTVFLGPNGSGKSTIFDVFAFLAECFSVGLRKAWDRRGRFRELRSRGAEGPIVIELKYRERPTTPVITYHLAIDENPRGPFVAEEWLQWRRGQQSRPFRFLDFRNGAGRVVSGEAPDEQDTRIEEQLTSPELLAVNTLGQFASHPRVSALRRFITGWYLSNLHRSSIPATVIGMGAATPHEHLSANGDNLPNVVAYLEQHHPERFYDLLRVLTRQIPQLELVRTELTSDQRLQLLFKDLPFSTPFLASSVSEGTLKLLAYLTILYDPDPPQLIGFEEPENQLHPRLLMGFAESCRLASASSQLIITSHAPHFLNGLLPEEVWVLFRNEDGFTKGRRAADMRGVKEFMAHGAQLGSLWTEGHFDAGDPLQPPGRRREV